jgi:hypothetical protein
MKLLIRLFLAIIISAISLCPVQAQPVSWTQVDIGGTGATGTYSYSSGTYTISGAGASTGIGGTSDSFSYVYTSTTGNVEMFPLRQIRVAMPFQA